jgi:hypothetical protein
VTRISDAQNRQLARQSRIRHARVTLVLAAVLATVAASATGAWAIHRSALGGGDPGVAADGAAVEGDARRNWWGTASGPGPDDCVGTVACADALAFQL